VTFVVVFWLWASPTWATCTGSSPTWTSTPDYASVSSCVSSASRGDTVNVTAGGGTETWGSTLSLTKGVKLIGPGRDSLEITSSTTFISILPDATAVANDEIIRVKGFSFDGNATALQGISINARGVTNTKAFKNLVIEANRFRNMNPTTSNNATIYSIGQVRGVVANNLFVNVNVFLRCLGNDLVTDWTSGNFPVAFGSVDNLYFEDNTLTWTTTQGNDPGWSECGQAGRVVLRYNTWDFTDASNSDTWDAHGWENAPGTMMAEYYGNTLNAKANRWLAYRGGQGLIFNNQLTNAIGSQTNSINMISYDIGCNSRHGGTPDGEIYLRGFNNTVNGTPINLYVFTGSGYNNVCPLIEDKNYWNHKETCTTSACASGIGRGTTAPTSTCITGVGYWVASTPTPTVDRNVIQNGALYKCTSTNVWTIYYRPFIYPHPLRSGSGSGSGADTQAPQAPTGLTIS